jgi:hypothetical protein
MPRDLYVFDLTTKPLHNITLESLRLRISRDQACKWGIEWDVCAGRTFAMVTKQVPD